MSIDVAPGTRYWIEYYALGSGGYQESGEISGTVTAPPEIVRQPVRVPVIEAGIISLSLGTEKARAPRMEHRQPAAHERRAVPLGEISVDDGAPQPGLIPTS